MPSNHLLLAAAFLAVAVWPVSAAAQTFEELEQRLAKHPSLAELAFNAEAASETALAATALPDPEFSIGVDDYPVYNPQFYGPLPVNTEIGVRQEIPSLAARRARAAGSEATAAHFRMVRDGRYAALRGELIALLIERSRLSHQIRLLDERAALYTELVDVTSTEIDAGRPAVFRIAEIESERAEVSRERTTLEAMLTQTAARLTELVGDVVTTEPPVPLTVQRSGNANDFHAVRIAGAEVSITGAGVDEAAAAWKPNWGLQLNYELRDEMQGTFGRGASEDDVVAAMVTFTLPIWSAKSQAPRLRAAQASRAAARSRLDAAARSALAQYISLEAMRTQAEQSSAILGEKISAIEAAVAAQLITYESGSGDYAPIIDGEIAILRLRAEIIAEDSLAAVATARMNALLVTP